METLLEGLGIGAVFFLTLAGLALVLWVISRIDKR